MRNPTALAFQPETGEFYALVQERDGLGDRLPPDFLTRVQKGGFYGWPYAYIGKHPQPGFASAPEKVKRRSRPTCCSRRIRRCSISCSTTAISSPPEYKGRAFVALKGSWNSSEPTGYKVVRVPFKDGRPEGYYENFATGFWASASAAPRSGDDRRHSRSRRTARSSSPMTPAERSGVFPMLASATTAPARTAGRARLAPAFAGAFRREYGRSLLGGRPTEASM